MSLFQATTIMGLLATGMGVALVGSVKLPLARKLQINETRVGGMVSMFGFAMIPTMLVVGFVTDLVGKQPVVIGGSLFMTASLVLLAQSRTYGPALLGVLLLSVGWATLINVINPLALFAFPGAETYAMNMACFFFGLGAFVTPLAAAFLLRHMELPRVLLVLAGFVVLTALLAVGVDFSTLTATGGPQAAAAAPPKAGIGTLVGDSIMLAVRPVAFLLRAAGGNNGGVGDDLPGQQGGERGRSGGVAIGLLAGLCGLALGGGLCLAGRQRSGGDPCPGGAVRRDLGGRGHEPRSGHCRRDGGRGGIRLRPHFSHSDGGAAWTFRQSAARPSGGTAFCRRRAGLDRHPDADRGLRATEGSAAGVPDGRGLGRGARRDSVHPRRLSLRASPVLRVSFFHIAPFPEMPLAA